MRPLELWAGPEATVNRVGDTHLDQLEASGFAARLDDLDRLASLGVRRIRFPLLWERTEVAPGDYDWSWADERLERLRRLGVAPIMGLVHHGSGPRHTDLHDPAFPDKLAGYAAAVARRYPWVEAYTPVNEPLTTARFSGLYGVWYPHVRSDAGFVRALLQQIHGTRLAMAAVRAVNPAARLVQTEDIGHTSGTEPLQYQCAFDNQRRWLSLDLLTGRVDREHPLWSYLSASGATEAELEILRSSPTAPDVIALNVYVPSERYLDHRLERYPPHLHGGNGRDAYADTEAVRVRGAALGGFEARLGETAARYGGQLVIGEAHLGCTREEQMRWLLEAWQAATALRQEGVDVAAVTLWAAFGTYDWDSLLTQRRGHYEPGAWDVRSDPPRPTALAAMARELSAGCPPGHPVLQGPGWWRRDIRWLYPPEGACECRAVQGRPLLICGGRGTLAQAFARLCVLRGLPYRLLSRADLDIADAQAVEQALQQESPWAVINAAGYVRVDEAEHDERQWRENALAPVVLAQACKRWGARLVTFSSDLVFDGQARRPYLEHDTPQPLNAYGRAKHAAEQQVLACSPEALVVRTSAFFGPWDRYNFLTLGLQALERGEPWRAVHDQVVSPTYVPDLVHAVLDLLVDGAGGLWHLANAGSVSWAELARLTCRLAGHPVDRVHGVAAQTLGPCAPKPLYSVLASERAALMPSLDDALARYWKEMPAGLGMAPPPPTFGLPPHQQGCNGPDEQRGHGSSATRATAA
ncbi:sugar nucleotide-binding protein [Caldimonas brevitalea]|uniref:dTDP-4-dehydrorhamnose reductase n=1 Tax=Caldimonas brevitalea TaxID=413882 RepID=A0A0G3BJC7_9BURK|nr:sugar nucleotide-binding protein [Caldimonas brevitalea]AKJ27476.1 dTDP-4-dehydrorhamnose reductase [Caldimonas brevitalea]